MKPYLLFKNKLSPYWYAQIRLPDGTLTSNKSTKKESKAEAERVVMEWIVNGSLPTSYGNKGKSTCTTSLEFVSVLNVLKTRDFSEDEIDAILTTLKDRNIVSTVIRPKQASDRDLMEFLEEFWNIETSPYIKELAYKGKTIHYHYAKTNLMYINRYWRPLLEGKKIGEVTKNDINQIFYKEDLLKKSTRSVHGIVNSIVQPMKWAHAHDLTEINCYDGIIKPTIKHKKREILTLEETRALFNAEWDNQTAKLACLIACYTGMRSGEIQALRMQDIGDDRIYIRHSWDPYEGLKCPKNGETREIKIPQKLRELIIYQASFNPYEQGMSGFIFFNAVNPEKPMDQKVWVRNLRYTLAKIGHKDPKSICFHSFRHEWCTNQLSEIGDERICMVGSGHKSNGVFEHYADHIQKENALNKIADSSERLYGDLIASSAMEIDYSVEDAEIEPITQQKLLPAQIIET